MARRLAYLALFVLAGFLGRATIIDGEALSLVWPAAGVAVLWLMSSYGRERVIDLVVLAVASFAVNRSTGSSTAMGIVFIAANLIQVLTAVAVIERGFPTWPRVTYGGPLDSPRRLMTLLVASVTGAVAGTAVGVTGLRLVTGFFSIDSTLTWWGRNAVGILGVASIGLLVLRSRSALRGGRRTTHHTTRWYAELTALVVATSLLVLANLSTSHLPVAFLLPALTVWAGMRFGSLVVALHAVLAGSAAVLLTLLGEGPFNAVESAQRGTLLAQLFVGMTVIIGLFLAAAREESHVLQAGLQKSEQRASEQALVMTTIIRAMQDGVLVLTEDGRIALINPAAARFLGRDVTSLLGQPADEVLLATPGGTLRQVAEGLAAAPSTGRRADVRLEGSGPVLSATATALTGPGDGHGLVMVLTDVTEERARREDLASFAGVVAHDLLNPITAIDGWTQLLADSLSGAQPEDTGHLALERIQVSTQRMRELVNDLLADATADNAAMRVEHVDLGRLVGDVVSDRNAEGCVRVGCLPEIEGDPRLLRQLVDNVVGNALKYVRPGTLPEVEVEGHVDEFGMVIVRVSDHGIGIAEADRDAVFSRFERGSRSTVAGTGLGLAICRRIVERHAGHIRLLGREDGPGTVVEIILPAHQPATAAQARDLPVG